MKPKIPNEGIERDVFTAWRNRLKYLINNSKLKAWAKRKYNKRVRKQIKNEVKDAD